MNAAVDAPDDRVEIVAIASAPGAPGVTLVPTQVAETLERLAGRVENPRYDGQKTIRAGTDALVSLEEMR